MIRYATVGTSAITEKFIAAAALTGRYIHSAVYSRTKEKGEEFAKRVGCSRVITDLSELANDKSIDAVYIASPNYYHYMQSKLLLENGKHVLCEMPVCSSASYYRELRSIAAANGVIFMEAMPPRFAPTRKAVLEALGKIGKITSARIDYSQLSSRYPELLRGEKPNIFNMSLHAGTLMDLGVYCVAGAVDLLGVPQEIYAKASMLPVGCDGGGTAVFDYGEFLATLTYSKVGQSQLGSEIIGDRGTLKIGYVSQYANVSLVTADGEETICGMCERAELMAGEAVSFADFITDKTKADEYLSVCKQTYEVLRCMDKIKQSAGLRYKRLKKECF